MIEFPIRMGLNFDQAKTNNAITHVMVLSDKVRRNEWCKNLPCRKIKIKEDCNFFGNLFFLN